MEYYNNILCIEAGWLISENILSESNYKLLRHRNKIDVVRRGCLNTPALVAYDSIPQRFKKLIIAKIGDPYKAVPKSKLSDLICSDSEIRNFFRDYITSKGDRLPEKAQKEYVANAEILKTLHHLATNKKEQAKTIGNSKSKGLWLMLSEAVSKLDKTKFNHSLPKNPRRLQDKYKKFMAEGCESLIHGNWCNSNSEKINDLAKVWILSKWTSMANKVANEQQLLEEYNLMAESMQWKPLKSVNTIHNFLYSEEIKGWWWGHRYGELKFKEKFMYQQKTVLPSMRDSLWYSDGTKLNYYYQYRDANGHFKIGTTSVYEVMDVYSEDLLGYHISDKEDFEAQYNAYRMALQYSGQKPYEIRYDNQGGHKKLEAGSFLTKLSHLSIRTKPYNGKSKTIESAFGRFQSQFLKKDWFFTGQNITTKSNESKANLEFIMANKHNLPTLEEVKETYLKRRNEWKNALRPKAEKSRCELYKSSENPKAVKLELMDMVDLFWIQRPKQITCTGWGLSFTEKKEKFDYMVMRPDGLPDVEWLAKNIDKKFVVKYDPTDFSMIYLYEDTPQGLRFITSADQKIEVHRNIQEQEEWEASWMKQVDGEINKLREEYRETISEYQKQFGELPEQNGLKTPTIKGVNVKKKNTPAPKKQSSSADNFGKLQKALSNALVAADDDSEFDENELYNLM